ncbi:MAG TPA: aspartate/glutamate racemase family protein [Gaiellaceae bacterium]|nr:aspartate/glutamate racemase family protein [Gaiellaceae bacterium]
MRIWWQSFVDPHESPAYFEQLAAHLRELAHETTTVDVVGLTPPDRSFGRLTELRCAVLAVDNALEAAERGYDAFAFGHFQDPGLYEARSAVDIPVTGLGEATLHWAAQLGRRLALVSIDPVFDVWHREQADLYGLGGRISHVVGLGALVEDFAPAFAGDDAARSRLLARFRELAEPLVADGADVIVPAGALPALLLAGEHGAAVGRAPVVNSVAVLLKCTEAAVELRRLTGLGPGRGPSFAPAPPQAVADFRSLLADGRSPARPGDGES